MISMNQTIIDGNKTIESGKQSEMNTDKKMELLDKWTLLDLVHTIGSGAMLLGLRRHRSIKFWMIDKFNHSSFQYPNFIFVLIDVEKISSSS